MGAYNNLGGSSLARKILHLIQGSFLAYQPAVILLHLMGVLKFLLCFRQVAWNAELMAFKWVLPQNEVVKSWVNNDCVTVCPASKWLIKIKFLVLSLQVFLPLWRRQMHHYQPNDDNTHSTEWAMLAIPVLANLAAGQMRVQHFVQKGLTKKF